MYPSQNNLHLPAEQPIFFDDFATRDAWKAGQTQIPFRMSPMPATNVYETAEALFIELVVPGIAREELRFFATDSSIEVRYQPEGSHFESYGERRVWHAEYHPTPFQRKFEFHAGMLDMDALRVDVVHGVLRFEIPKKEEFQGRLTPSFSFSLN